MLYCTSETGINATRIPEFFEIPAPTHTRRRCVPHCPYCRSYFIDVQLQLSVVPLGFLGRRASQGASNRCIWFAMAQVGVEDPKSRLEKIKKQLSAGSGSVLLHGPLLKRSETLRKWNQLDPSTGKMECRYILIKGDLHLPEHLMKWCF